MNKYNKIMREKLRIRTFSFIQGNSVTIFDV